MSFPNKPDIDVIMASMVDKFALHGLVPQSKRFGLLYEKLMSGVDDRDVMVYRLNVIRFLLATSKRPTAQDFHFASNIFQRGDSMEVINWPEYLREGVERWSPTYDSDSVSTSTFLQMIVFEL